MGGGVFFVKKSGKWVFCKKKWKMVFFVKKVDLSSTQGTLCTLSVFFILHFTYFFGRGGSCICTQRTPLPTGLENVL